MPSLSDDKGNSLIGSLDIVGALNPVVKDASGEIIDKGATVLEPIGTVFINLMFCVVVPMVFCSIASAIANMSSAKRAGKVMGLTVGTFFVTAAIAAVIMYVIVRLCPVVTGDYTIVEGEVSSTLSVTDMIINFFTKPTSASCGAARLSFLSSLPRSSSASAFR